MELYFNVGTTLEISGKDYAVVAADTRLSSGYEIWSRNSTKLYPLTPRCVPWSAGCKIDFDQLRSARKNRNDEKRDLPAKEGVEIVKDAFVTAGERDIYTGDSVEIMIIRKDGITSTTFSQSRLKHTQTCYKANYNEKSGNNMILVIFF